MALELSGKLIKFYDKKDLTPTFSVREFVIQTVETYPQEIVVQATNKKIEDLDRFQINDSVEIKFNLRGRPAKDRHFVSLDLWTINLSGAGNTTVKNPSSFTEFVSKAENSSVSSNAERTFDEPKMTQTESDFTDSDGNDLPF
ncbi:MAG: DUF3127 domain-containing protein [Sediminibacterium sp.]